MQTGDEQGGVGTPGLCAHQRYACKLASAYRICYLQHRAAWHLHAKSIMTEGKNRWRSDACSSIFSRASSHQRWRAAWRSGARHQQRQRATNGSIASSALNALPRSAAPINNRKSATIGMGAAWRHRDMANAEEENIFFENKIISWRSFAHQAPSRSPKAQSIGAITAIACHHESFLLA